MMRACCWMMCLLAFITIACDDKNDLTPEDLRARQQAEDRAKAGITPLPTTRELAETPTLRVRLGDFPVSIQIPKTWKLNSEFEGAPITLGGMASSGDIKLQLMLPNQTATKAQIDAMFLAAQKEVAAKPHPINRVELKDLGPVKVLEQRMISNEYVKGKLPPEEMADVELTRDPVSPGEQPVKIKSRAVKNPHMVKWTISMFIPAGEKYSIKGLVFQTLKLSEYEQDKEFLEKLVGSMRYEE